MSDEKPPLTPKQEAFCFEYIVDSNGTQAAIRAGYAENSANEQAARMLAKDSIKQKINELKKQRNDKVLVEAADVIKELLYIAKTDISKAFDDKGNLLPVKDMPEEIRRSIAGIEVLDEFSGYGKDREKIGETTKIKLWDKPKSLELLGRHLKLFTDKIEHSGKVTLEALVEGSMEDEK